MNPPNDTHCWVPDERNVFKVALIVDRGDKEVGVVDIDMSSGQSTKAKYSVPVSSTHKIFSLDELHTPPSDLIQLTDVHRPGILHALRYRFERNLIYTR
jgi:myosin heavy subunit